jgi:hypothetical protein
MTYNWILVISAIFAMIVAVVMVLSNHHVIYLGEMTFTLYEKVAVVIIPLLLWFRSEVRLHNLQKQVNDLIKDKQ